MIYANWSWTFCTHTCLGIFFFVGCSSFNRSLSKSNNSSTTNKTFDLGSIFWILVAVFILINAFLVNDFSVRYVAENSNTQLPTLYKVSALWAAHEGSLLLWVFILSLWSIAVSIFSKQIPSAFLNQILVVFGFISFGFLLFLLLTSNPFERLLIPPLEGRELNPLLQDFGLAVHPPMLYIGYVGLSVPLVKKFRWSMDLLLLLTV